MATRGHHRGRSHDVFDVWIGTPERDLHTASGVHQSVDIRPITRYDLVGGYTNLGLLALADPEEES